MPQVVLIRDKLQEVKDRVAALRAAGQLPPPGVAPEPAPAAAAAAPAPPAEARAAGSAGASSSGTAARAPAPAPAAASSGGGGSSPDPAARAKLMERTSALMVGAAVARAEPRGLRAPVWMARA